MSVSHSLTLPAPPLTRKQQPKRSLSLSRSLFSPSPLSSLLPSVSPTPCYIVEQMRMSICFMSRKAETSTCHNNTHQYGAHFRHPKITCGRPCDHVNLWCRLGETGDHQRTPHFSRSKISAIRRLPVAEHVTTLKCLMHAGGDNHLPQAPTNTPGIAGVPRLLIAEHATMLYCVMQARETTTCNRHPPTHPTFPPSKDCPLQNR
jgi:hypothetical protein